MQIIFISLLAGVIGMGLGGILTALFGSKSDKTVGIFLSFAGGVMMSIVFLELIPEAIEHSNIFVTIAGIVAGVFLVWTLNALTDRISSSDNRMLRSGIIMLVAIGLHNVPEGLALGAAGHHDLNLGITLAIIIGLHNIPEGMAVSAPLIAGGLSKIKSVLFTLLIGTTTVIGAAVGVLVGGISDIAVAFSFSIAGGAMLYVVLGEILPQSIVASNDRTPAIFALIGIVVGMLFIAIF